MAEAPREHADGAAGVPAVAEASDGQVGHAALYQRGEEAIVSENRRSAALATLCLVLFLTFLDITIVSVALAGLQTQLRAGVSSLQWVVGAYALTFASTMLAFGTIGDQFGRKKVLLIGICIFIAGALMSGLSVIITSGSSALAIVIAGRAVMGLGAAASEPGTLSMLRHIYPDYTSRNWALGVWAAVSGSALALGPVVGGALVYAWGWPAIFWFNVLVGLIAVIAAVIVLPENSDPTDRRIDITGAVFGAVALGALIYAVIDAESIGFASGKVIALLSVSVVFLEEVAGYNGGQIATVFLPMTILMIVASLLAGRWTGSVGIRWSIVGGCAAFAGGLLWTNAVISPSPPYLPLAAALALTGIGIGACVVPITSSVLAVVPPERSGMAASTTNTSREVGAVMGVAILGAIVIGKLQTALVAKLSQLGLTKGLQQFVINGVLTGQEPSAGGTSAQAPAGQGALVREVIQATYSAFQSGLHDALYVSAGLVAGAGILTAVTITVASDRAQSARPVD